ncbi:MAG: DUF2283 domain-containing protein [Promethearchaeota archaeon]
MANALYLRFSNEEIQESDEIAKGIIVDYGKNEQLVGVEILNFTDRNLNLNDLVQKDVEEIIPMIVECL